MKARALGGMLPDFGGQAACSDLDPDLFFPDAAGQEQFRARDVHDFCRACPVADACLEYAIANRVEGVWAGTSTAQRRELRRRAGITHNPQQQRHERARSTVADLTRKGFTSEQIVAHTGIHEATVYRVRRSLGAANGQRDVA